jgi:hypothetical protein
MDSARSMAQDAWQAHPLNRSPKIVKNTLALLALAASGLLLVPVGAKAQAGGGLSMEIQPRVARSRIDRRQRHQLRHQCRLSQAIGTGTLIGFEVGYMDFGRFSVPLTLTAIILIGTPPLDPVTTTSGSGHHGHSRATTIQFSRLVHQRSRRFHSHQGGRHLRISPIDGSIVRERRATMPTVGTPVPASVATLAAISVSASTMTTTTPGNVAPRLAPVSFH